MVGRSLPTDGQDPWGDDFREWVEAHADPNTGLLLPHAVEAAAVAAGLPSATEWFALKVSRTTRYDGRVANAAALGTGVQRGSAKITMDDLHLHIWNGASWDDIGPFGGPPGPPGSTGQGSVFLDNALNAAFGYLLADGQVTFTVGGPDGLPIPEAVALLVEALDRDGVTLGGGGEGTVTSVNEIEPDETGDVTLTAADVLPSQTGHGGKYLTTNGTEASWETGGGSAPAGMPERVPTGRIININNLALVGTYAGMTPTTWTTYDGSGVIVHPCVRFFPDGFNGHQWWAAATPYPNSNTNYENPSIFVSTNGTAWVPPPGVTNPLVPDPDPGDTEQYNNDPYLTMGPDGMLYLFFRSNDVGPGDEWLWVMHSTDGITWSSPVNILHTLTSEDREFMSHSAWYDANTDQWVMIAVQFRSALKQLRRWTAVTPEGPWTEVAAPTVSPAWGGSAAVWHAEFIPVGSQVVGIALVDDVGWDGGASYLLVSNDGGATFTRATDPIVAASTTDYKSSLVPLVTEYGLSFDLYLGERISATVWGAKRGILARTS